MRIQETWVQFLGQQDPLENEMATHSSILAWEVPWIEVSGALESMGSQRDRTKQLKNNNSTWLYAYAFILISSWTNGMLLPLQSCPTLCDPMDCSLSGSSIHGIFQARVLEWVAISFSRGSSWPRYQTQVSWGSWPAGAFFTTELPGYPYVYWTHYKLFFSFFNVDHLKTLHWICYNIDSVLCFGFLAKESPHLRELILR